MHDYKLSIVDTNFGHDVHESNAGVGFNACVGRDKVNPKCKDNINIHNPHFISESSPSFNIS